MKNIFEQPLIIDNQQQELSNVSDISESDVDDEKKKNFETITLEIDGKKYEVIKTHFTYPEHIQKENGGVEGYDRFKLSWDNFDKEELDKVGEELKAYYERGEYNKLFTSLYKKKKGLLGSFTAKLYRVSEKLGIGTEMKEETISHYTNAFTDKSPQWKWNDNRFFLNKPFDVEDVLEFIKKNRDRRSPYDVSWYVLKNGKSVDVIEFLKHYSPEYVKQYERFDTNFFSTEGVFKDLQDFDAEKMLEFLKDKDKFIEKPGMSFAQGSHLSEKSAILGGENHEIFSTPFFNFNNRNTAFVKYIKNITEYKESIKDREVADLMGIKLSGNYDSHPRISLVFTDKFPAFRWCFADTAYVPMKDGPNFFRFYSEDNEVKNSSIVRNDREEN